MRGARIVALALGALIVAVAVEAQVGSTRYALNGATYAVPHKYEFTRNFRLPWLEGLQGLDKEPDESVWLLLPASEVARDIPSYSRMFHGYSSEVEADMVVNVLGGKEAAEFPQDRSRFERMVAEAIASGEGPEDEKLTGWERVYSMRGTEGTPGMGHSSFFLLPKGGLKELPAEWLPPMCQSSPDINGRETYHCAYTIFQDGLTFDFSLRQVNLGVAPRIPDYVMSRLKEWRS
ncbi:MAG TPA: hypothetical protein VGR19_07235 [Allosphingosinicella sp.]|nr:hypothetical protein [Allosphingosinicella sp.]